MKATVTLADPEETLVVDVDSRDRRLLEGNLATLLGLPVSTAFTKIIDMYPQTAHMATYWNAARRAGHDIAWEQWNTRFLDAADEEEAGVEDPPTIAAPSAAH